jgi:hypothetical protein
VCAHDGEEGVHLFFVLVAFGLDLGLCVCEGLDLCLPCLQLGLEGGNGGGGVSLEGLVLCVCVCVCMYEGV